MLKRIGGLTLLAIVAAAAGAACYWAWDESNSAEEWFEPWSGPGAVGLIRVRYDQPKLMYDTDFNGPMPMYEQYLDTHAMLLQDRRTIETAMFHEVWRELKGPPSHATVRQFVESLHVRVVPGTELIEVFFANRDPETAKAAVEALLDAYMELHGRSEVAALDNRLQLLDQRSRRLRDEITLIEAQRTQELQRVDTQGVDPERLESVLLRRLLTTGAAIDQAYIELSQGGEEGPGRDPDPRILQLRAWHEQNLDRLEVVSEVCRALKKLDADLTKRRTMLEQTLRRIEQLNTEARNAQRIEIVGGGHVVP